MRGNVPGVVWPAIATGNAATVATLLRELDRTQWLPAEVIRQAQFHQLRVLAGQLAATSPYFRGRLAGAGLRPDDLGTPSGLRALPPMTRRDIQDAGDQLFAASVPGDHGGVAELRTAGSTGEPVAVLRTALNGIVWSAMTLRDHLWRDVDFGGRITSCRLQASSLTIRPSWGRPISLLFDSGPSQAVPLLASLEDLADALVAFSPHVLQVYPSVVGPLAELLRDRGERLPHLRHVHTIAETLMPEDRDTATALLDASVWDTYSCEEVGNIALECPSGDGYHVMAESVLVEILDEEDAPCEEGQRGRVVVTDLHNAATPLVRYDLGDYAEVGGACGCGRGLPTLRRVLGRRRNLVLLPDGTRHWPVVGMHAFHRIAKIRQFQFVQRERDTIDVLMVVDAPLAERQEQMLVDVLQAALGHPFAFRFDWRDEPLPRTPQGKFEQFRCEI